MPLQLEDSKEVEGSMVVEEETTTEIEIAEETIWRVPVLVVEAHTEVEGSSTKIKIKL